MKLPKEIVCCFSQLLLVLRCDLLFVKHSGGVVENKDKHDDDNEERGNSSIVCIEFSIIKALDI
jgi:hypothetical protein